MNSDNLQLQKDPDLIIDGGSPGTIPNPHNRPNPNPNPSSETDSGSNFDSGGTRAGGDEMGFNPDIWSDSNLWDAGTLKAILQRFGLSPERAEYEAQRMLNNLVYTGNDVPIFSPDPNASPEDNLANLSAWLSHAIAAYEVNNSLGFDKSFNFANQLIRIYTALSNSGNSFIADLSDEATLEISEKITDQLFSFINTQFSAVMSYQSWYLQQEYNSPLNQINRLAAAGLHSSFALGSVNSGNAQSSASMPTVQNVPASNAGQAEASSHGNLLSFIGSIASTAVSMIPGVGSLISSACTLALSPLQLANAKAELKNNGATFEKLQNEARLIEQNLQINSFNSSLQAEQFGLNSAGLQVEQAKNLFEQDYNQFTQELEVEGWRTLVQDKQGHRKFIDLTNEEKEAFKNNGYTTSDGWTSVKDSSASFGGSLGYSADSHGSMFGFGGKAESKYGVDYGSKVGKSESESGSAGTSSSAGESLKTLKQGYNENGTIERSGETTFTSVTIRKRVPKDEFRQYLQSSYDRYKKALDNYNFLSEGARARLLNMVDNMQRNAAKYSSMNVYESFMNQINNSFKKKEIDKTLIGD